VKQLGEDIRRLMHSTVKKGVEFVIQVEPPRLVIEGDRQRFMQVLINLVHFAGVDNFSSCHLDIF
jgi:signal transduction histidine kinase